MESIMKIEKPISIAELISTLIIPHTAYANTVNGCNTIIDMGLRTRRPNNGMIIMGHGGTGKSTVISHIQKYIVNKYSGKFSTPVLIIKISSDTTIKSFYINILTELNHPILIENKDKNITADKLQRLVITALKKQVCTLFIDEVSDVFSNRLKKSFPSDFLVMIKHLASDTSINIILAGTLALKSLLAIADHQFLTRFPTVFELPIFINDAEWVRLLNAYEIQARPIFDLSILAPLHNELHWWTGGNLRDLSSLLITAIDIAEQEKVTRLTVEHLNQAQQCIFPNFKAA